jgi:putative endonuclease
MQKGGYTYILTNKNHTTLYIGVTSNLLSRTLQHKGHTNKTSFSHNYNLEKLVFYQSFDTIEDAIGYEKKLKKWRKEKKLDLINGFNPEWKDLFEDITNSI